MVISFRMQWFAQQDDPVTQKLVDNYVGMKAIVDSLDGNEERVLRGADGVLRERRPVILVEVYERNANAVTDLLHAHGYTLYDFNSGESRKAVIRRTVYNTLALPSGR